MVSSSVAPTTLAVQAKAEPQPETIVGICRQDAGGTFEY